MARHSIKEVEDSAIQLLNVDGRLNYLSEDIRSYENEMSDMVDKGEILEGPRIWIYYSGSNFPRTEIDNAYVHNEQLSLHVIVYDNSYAGAEDAAAGDLIGGNHPGTRRMIEDVKDRLMSEKPFTDCSPFILTAVERIDIPVSGFTVSAYRVSFQTEFDYGGPV